MTKTPKAWLEWSNKPKSNKKRPIKVHARPQAPIRDTGVYKSFDDGSYNCGVKVPQKYTGSLVKGIGTMHKSNAVPIIDEQHMKDIATMRRN